MNKHAFLPSMVAIAWTVVLSPPAIGADLLNTIAPVFPSPAGLAWNDIVRANNQVSLDFAETHFDYLETDTTGAALDSERGWLPGLSISGSLMRDFFTPNVYLYGRFTWATGHTNYVGAIGAGTYGSFLDTDGAEVFDEDFRLGKGFAVTNSVMLTPYIGGGAHQWSRNLTGQFGYHEDYQNGYVGGGMLVQFSPVGRLVLSANGLVGTTLGALMNSSLTAGGAPIIPQTYYLRSSVIFRGGGSADYAITDNIHANVGIDYVNFKYGQSAVSSIDGSFEPTSRTSNVTMKAGLGYGF